MSQLNDSVADLANFWDELHREDVNLTLKLEELLGTEKSEQLQASSQTKLKLPFTSPVTYLR